MKDPNGQGRARSYSSSQSSYARVGGSIPSLATLLMVGLAGCSPCGAFSFLQGSCERVCCDVADAVEACDQVSFEDLGATTRDAFVDSCTDDWVCVNGELTSSEVQEATASCRSARDRLDGLDLSAEGCAELAGLYDTDTP